MAVYTVTAANWNDPSFWSGISESGTGHTLDFSALGPGFTVSMLQSAGTITLSDGATAFTVGEAGAGPADVNLGGTTQLESFTTVISPQGGSALAGSGENEDLQGNAGADSLRGEAGDDTIHGGAGADRIDGGDGNDHLEGGWEDASADTISGGAGNDIVFSYGGDDSVLGGDGKDWIDGGAGDDHLEGNEGIDAIIGDEGSDTILGGAGSDILSGGEGRDSIDGGDGPDAIWGNAGDTILGGEGGVDNDTLYVSYVDFITYTTAESGTVTFNSGDTLAFSGIEQIVEQTPDGVVEGTSGDDQIGQFQYDADGDWIDNGDAIGEGDGDSVRAGDGNDSIWSGDGADTVHGEAGDDQIDLGDGNNVAFGGSGADTITAQWQNDTISGDDYTTTGPNLIVNGSFEDTTGMTAAWWGYAAPGGSIAGWTDANGTQLDVVDNGRGGLDATDGANWLDMEAGSGRHNEVSQAVAGVVDGEVYILRFDVADKADGSDGTTIDNQMQVIWNGDVVGTIDGVDGDWRSYEFNLIGGSGDGSNTLTFSGMGAADADGVSLDNVQMFAAAEAQGGDDSIMARGGDDDIMGGAGDDTIDAGSGNDEVVAGSGDDSVLGGAGNDEIYGGSGRDTLSGGSGRDTLIGGAGDDSVDGGGGQDLIHGDEGNDSIQGGADDDTIFGGAGRDSIDGGAGNDSLVGGAGNDVFFGSSGADTVEGGTGSDDYYVIDGFDGGVVDLGGDNLVTDDGRSVDFMSFYDVSSAVDITFTSATGGTATSAAGEALTFQNVDGFEGARGFGGTFDASAAGFDVVFYDYGGMTRVTGSDYGDLLVAYGADPAGITDRFYDGGAGDDTIDTGDGDDTIFGGSGDDQIVARDGNNSVEGGSGNDTIFGGEDADYLAGGSGSDSLLGGRGRDTLAGGEGADFIQGNQDADLADYSASDAGVTIVLDGGGAAGTASGGHAQGDTIVGIDDLLGSDFDDSLTGYDATHGSGISNMIDGGAGNDTIAGLGGDDSLTGGSGDDSITGGEGNDTLVYAAGDGNDTITDFIFGNTGTLDDGDSTNNDFIDLSAFYDDIWDLHADQADDGILNQSNTGPGGADYSNNASFGSGSLTFTGASADSSSFTSENTGVICFAQDTLILTPQGEIPVGRLRAGDLVVTRDNGVRPIVWAGARHIPAAELALNPKLRPIWVAPDITGGAAPLIVSPQHGVLVQFEGGEETLVRATHLARLRGGRARVMRGCRKITYVHLMFEAHQIIFANGAPAESFYPGPNAFGALSLAARSEVLHLFPQLDPALARNRPGPPARRFARFAELPRHLGALSQAAG